MVWWGGEFGSAGDGDVGLRHLGCLTKAFAMPKQGT